MTIHGKIPLNWGNKKHAVRPKYLAMPPAPKDISAYAYPGTFPFVSMPKVDEVAEGQISPEQVVELVSKYYCVPIEELRGTSKHGKIARGRQVTIYLIRKYCGPISLKDAGGYLGKHEHTTPLYSCKTIEALIKKEDKKLLFQLRQLKAIMGITESNN